MYLVVQAFWFLLPALTSNMAPVLAQHMPFLDRFNTPIDRGLALRGKPLLGANKTYRGFVAGMAFALTTGCAQWILSTLLPTLERLTLVEPTLQNYVMLAGLLGFGALLGDSLESFFKRQLDIPSGSPWTPFDQLDFILGAYALSASFVSLTLREFSAVLFIGVALHLITVFIGFKIGVRDAPI